jgi:hypothetical protein
MRSAGSSESCSGWSSERLTKACVAAAERQAGERRLRRVADALEDVRHYCFSSWMRTTAPSSSGSELTPR